MDGDSIASTMECVVRLLFRKYSRQSLYAWDEWVNGLDRIG